MARLEEIAALLERAYRMALVLQGRACMENADGVDVPVDAFERIAVTKELLALLDELRIRLFAESRRMRCRQSTQA